jgi:hypothetical protein
MSGLRVEFAQFTLLTRHFFGRMFRNETVDFEDQMKEKVIVVLALLAVFFAWASWLLLFKYHFVADINRSWQEKNYILTLMMLVFAVVTLLEWDVLFPDRQDFLNLTPLPVRLRTVFAGKLASFILFVAMFSAAMMSISAALFSLYLTQWRADTLALAARYVVSHILAGFAANLAVFFSVVFVQFFLMAALPPAVTKKTAVLIRFALIVGLVFLLLSFVAAPTVLGRSFADLETLKESGSLFIFRFPPLWFVGLYEVLLGTHDAIFMAQARTAGLAVVLAIGAFICSAALSYRRHVRRTLEVGKSRPAFEGLRERGRRLLASILLRTPEERSVYGFFTDTLRASPKHRMSLVYYLAVGSATVLVLVAAYRESFRTLTPGNGLLLVLPLLLAFVFVAGVRAIVDRPAALEANWVFRLTETPRLAKYACGLKKAIVVKFILPFFVVVLVFHALLWDFRTALLHAVFGFVVASLGVEATFYHYRKIPFACVWVPGRFKLHFLVLPVVLGLLLGMTLLAAIEKAILADPSKVAIFLAGAAGLALLLREGNRRYYRTTSLLFDDAPEAALIELRSAADG